MSLSLFLASAASDFSQLHNHTVPTLSSMTYKHRFSHTVHQHRYQFWVITKLSDFPNPSIIHFQHRDLWCLFPIFSKSCDALLISVIFVDGRLTWETDCCYAQCNREKRLSDRKTVTRVVLITVNCIVVLHEVLTVQYCSCLFEAPCRSLVL